MRANIEATKGAVFAERAATMLRAELGRDAAHKILEDATRKSVKQKEHLTQVLAEVPEVTQHLHPAKLRRLEAPEEYLGSAEAFRKALLSSPASFKKTRK
jgi:3-carboxy-cis,cis-muconate cycloisomerase